MNLFKKDPEKLFELIAAVLLVVLAYYLALYFIKTEYSVTVPGNRMETIQPDGNQAYINPQTFGVIHIQLDAPSYAHSNFDVNPNGRITLYFNERLDNQYISNYFNLAKYGSSKPVPFSYMVEYKENVNDVENQKQWEKQWKERISFIPDKELDPVTSYTLEMKSGYADEKHTIFAPYTFVYEFHTADTPGFLNSNIENGETGVTEMPSITFKSPMSKNELQTKMIITPDIENPELIVTDKVVTIGNKLEKGTEYNIFVPSDTLDLYKRQLGEDIDLTFTTAE